MAAQGLIRHTAEGDLKVVFPFGGQEYEVHSLETPEEAHIALLCLLTEARPLESGQRAGAPAAPRRRPGSATMSQLVRELQQCMEQMDPVLAIEMELPLVASLMLTAVRLDCSSVARQLLLIDPAVALNADASHADLMPLHVAALEGRAALFKQLLAAAPDPHTFTANYDTAREWTLVHSAAMGGCVEVMAALLEAAPDAAGWVTGFGTTPLHTACTSEQVQAAQLLLDVAPELAAVPDEYGLPLHHAASAHDTAVRRNTAVRNSTAVLRLLLAAGAPGLEEPTADNGDTPLHLAAGGAPAGVPMLLDAYPAAALLRNGKGQLPLHLALMESRYGGPDSLVAARLLLLVSGLSADQLLGAVAEAGHAAQPLFADLAAHQPLSADQWQRVPMPCAGLGRALPALLARSDAEARQLVQHLPATDQQRLRLAALCLARVQRRKRILLPAPLVRAILAQSMSEEEEEEEDLDEEEDTDE